MNSAPPDRTHLSFGYLSLFGLSGLAAYYSTVGVQALATPVYQMTLGVNPAWLGLALAIPRVLDAFVDPLVGNISDNTRSRFGRRRPYIIAGSVAMALTFGLIWMVPANWSPTAQLGWFVATSVLFFFFHSVFSVPLQSLSYELTPDYDERTRVQGFSAFFNRIGELTYSWVFPLSQLAIFATPLVGVRTVAWGVAILFLALPGVVAGLVGRERFAQQAALQSKVRFWPTVRSAFANRPFRYLIALVVTTYLVGMLASSMDYYLLVYYVCHGDLKEGSFWKGVLSSAYGVVGLLSVPLLTATSKRIGKENTLTAVLALLVVGACARWWIFRPGAGWWVILDPILGGGALWVAISMVVQSMFADICDPRSFIFRGKRFTAGGAERVSVSLFFSRRKPHGFRYGKKRWSDEDELMSGQRREGLFGAVFSWLTKAGTSLAFMLTGFVLNAVGFDVALKADQAPSTILAMRLFLTVAPALAALACIVLLRNYPLSRTRADEIRATLERRRGAV